MLTEIELEDGAYIYFIVRKRAWRRFNLLNLNPDVRPGPWWFTVPIGSW